MKQCYGKHGHISHHSNNLQKSTKTAREEEQPIPSRFDTTNKQHNIDSNKTTQPTGRMKQHTVCSCSWATMRAIPEV